MSIPTASSTPSYMDDLYTESDDSYAQIRTTAFVFDSEDFAFDPPNNSGDHPSFLALKLYPSLNASARASCSPTLDLSEMRQDNDIDAVITSSENKRVQRPASFSTTHKDIDYQKEPDESRSRRARSANSLNELDEEEKRMRTRHRNRVAAAKSRINKRERHEQLQRDSHNKTMENTILKEQVKHLEGRIVHLNMLLETQSLYSGHPPAMFLPPNTPSSSPSWRLNREDSHASIDSNHSDYALLSNSWPTINSPQSHVAYSPYLQHFHGDHKQKMREGSPPNHIPPPFSGVTSSNTSMPIRAGIQPAVRFYLRKKDDVNGYFRAVYLQQRTMNDLLECVCQKFRVERCQIGQITYRGSQGLMVVVSDRVIRTIPDEQDMIVDIT